MKKRGPRTELISTSVFRGLGYEEDSAETEKVLLKFWTQEKTVFQEKRNHPLSVLLRGQG